jgi:hypothetical protein
VIKAIDGLKLKEDDRRKVYFGNAIRMLRLELPAPPKAKASKPRRAAKKAKRRR